MSAEVEQVLIVRKVRASSMYKLLLLGLLTTLVPLGIVFGISGFFGADTVKWNQQPVHGFAALIAGPAVSVLITLFFTIFFGSLACLGLWLLSRFRSLSVRVVMAQQGAQADRPASGGPSA